MSFKNNNCYFQGDKQSEEESLKELAKKLDFEPEQIEGKLFILEMVALLNILNYTI